MADRDDPAARATGAYVNAFQAGQALRARTLQPPRPAAPNAMTGGAPGAADPRGQIAALSPEQRIAAGRQAEILSAIGRGLANLPYRQRRSVLAHMTPALAARGVAPELVSGFDPTDQNLASAVRSAETIRGLISEGADQRAFAPAS